MTTCNRPTLNNGNVRNNNDFIKETIKEIDKLQKEVLTEHNCIGCQGALVRKAFNTKPVSFVCCSGEEFKAQIGAGGKKTEVFRIEEVRGDFVILRLIEIGEENGEKCAHCTNFTCILDLDCITALQCFEPINCRRCPFRREIEEF